MGRRTKTHISDSCDQNFLEDKENIKEFALAKDGKKKCLRESPTESLKYANNIMNLEEPKKIENIAKKKERTISSKVDLKNQVMLNHCNDDNVNSLTESKKLTKSLKSANSYQSVKHELNEQDFSEIKIKFNHPCITKEAVVVLERFDDIKEEAVESTDNSSGGVFEKDQNVKEIHSKSQIDIDRCECHYNFILKEAVVVLERYEDIQEKITKSAIDNSHILPDDSGKIKKVPNKSGKSTKRKREEKSKTEDEESSKSSKSKKQKSSNNTKGSKKEIPDVKAIDFSNDSKSSSGNSWNFKISSWNINGIRAWLEKNGVSYLHHEQPDIMCIQETKCSDDKLPDEMKNIEGYHSYWLSGDKDGYSGVGLLSKEKPVKVEYGIGIPEHDNEGRVITAEYDKFYLVSTYVPNAGRGLVRLDYRVKWDKDFREYLKKLDAIKPVILTGDLNVAHEEIDLANPKTNKKNAGFTKEEREGFSTLLGEGFIDTFRHLYPNVKGAYTFWTYMMNARAKNVGWRLDYFVISERFAENLCDSVIRKDVFGSDHCPVTLFLSL